VSETNLQVQLPEWQASLEAALQTLPTAGVLVLDTRSGEWREAPSDWPWRICQPSDLDPHQVVVMSAASALKAGGSVRYGFSLNWVGEAAPGKLDASVGVTTLAQAQARVHLELAGSALCQIRLEEGPRLRVRFERRRQRGLDLRARANVHAGLDASGETAELVAALLGGHPLQAVEALAEKALRGRLDPTLQRLLEAWRDLEVGAAAAIWRALEEASALSALRDFVHRLTVEAPELCLFQARFDPEEVVPNSPLEAWIEASAGTLLSAWMDAHAFKRLRRAAEAAERLLREESLLKVLLDLKQEAVRQTAAALAGGVPETVRQLAITLCDRGLKALEQKLDAQLNHAANSEAECALADCSFDFSEPGLAAYRAALNGDLSQALRAGAPAVQVHLGVLTHGLRRESRLQVDLPYLDRKQWSARFEALAQARIETTLDGRILVYTVAARDELGKHGVAESAMSLCGALLVRPAHTDARFSLGWSDKRRLSAVQARSVLPPLLSAYQFHQALAWLESELPQAAEVEAEMALSAPGEMVAAWLEAPVERSPNYGPVYTEVSVAVQRAMRTWLPYVYFSDLSRYDTLAAAYPLIVYQCTLPFRSKAKNEFAYDVMSAESVAVARRSTAWALGPELARIEQLLLAAGKPETARFYRPSRKDIILASVERAPRLLNSLLVADALFIDHLIALGVRAGGLRRAMEREPQRALRELVKFAEEFVKTFHRRLRRLYGGEDFTSFGPLILLEATRGLHAALRSTGEISGVLRLVIRHADGRVCERRFVNAAYRP